MSSFESKRVGLGSRLQAGIPKSYRIKAGKSAGGLLLRGVVTATYVSDESGHPQEENANCPPIAVYCDVLVYSNLPGMRWFGLTQVLVAQERAGLHDGTIWKPRAATVDFTGTIDPEGGTNPAYIDGDHVLVGFIDDCLDLPVIIRAIPHPSCDLGAEGAELGHRTKLKLEDGQPLFFRQHGSFFGVDTVGNFKTDTTHANDGFLDSAGKEPAPPTDGKGGQTASLPQDATWKVVLFDLTDPENPEEVATLEITKGGFLQEVLSGAGEARWRVADGESLLLTGKDAGASLKLGDGSKHVALAETLQSFYGSLKTALELWGGAGGHTHLCASPGSPSGPPVPVLTAPSWDAAIASQKLTVPAN